LPKSGKTKLLLHPKNKKPPDKMYKMCIFCPEIRSILKKWSRKITDTNAVSFLYAPQSAIALQDLQGK
jgi:hypothetical protein